LCLGPSLGLPFAADRETTDAHVPPSFTTNPHL
jgi:hypothetical protein